MVLLAGQEWESLCAAVGMTPKVTVDKIIGLIHQDKALIGHVNDLLAPYCAEVDPSRCSLEGTVDMLITEALKPGVQNQQKLENIEVVVRQMAVRAQRMEDTGNYQVSDMLEGFCRSLEKILQEETTT